MWVLSCLADKLLGKLCTFVEEGNRQSHLQGGDSLCGEEVSSADFSGCRRTVASFSPVSSFSLCFSRFVSSPFSSCSSSSFLSSRVWSSLSHDVLYPLSLSLPPSLCCLISSSRVPGHGQGTNGTHARVKRASGGRGWRLGRVSALLLVLPLNDVSPSLLFCRSLSLRGFSRSRRSEPKGQRGQSPPSSLSLRPSLFTAFTVDTDETPMGVTARHTYNLYTQTHTHTHAYTQTVSCQSCRQGCHGNRLPCLCVWTPIQYKDP